MKRMRETLKQLAGKKALLHCSSGNRTSAGLMPYLMIEKELNEEEATEVAMRGGLRSAELLELAVDYVRKQSA